MDTWVFSVDPGNSESRLKLQSELRRQFFRLKKYQYLVNCRFSLLPHIKLFTVNSP